MPSLLWPLTDYGSCTKEFCHKTPSDGSNSGRLSQIVNEFTNGK